MQALSQWGARHPWKSRLIITLSHFVLAAFALYWGALLADIEGPDFVLIKYIIAGLFLLAMLLYPIRGARPGWLLHTYRRQKIMDLALVFSGMLLVISHGATIMQESEPMSARGAATAVPIVLKESTSVYPSEKEEGRALKKEKQAKRKALRKALKEELRRLKQQKAFPKGILIALTILLALGLLLLLAALACSISCSGAEGLAILVFFGGLGLLAWGTIALIRRISRGPRP